MSEQTEVKFQINIKFILLNFQMPFLVLKLVSFYL